MIETRQLELDDARAAAAAATREAEANGWKVGISIVDAGGHLILYERMDGAPPSTARVSFEKAHTAAIFRTATAGMEDRIADRPGMMVLPGAADQRRPGGRRDRRVRRRPASGSPDRRSRGGEDQLGHALQLSHLMPKLWPSNLVTNFRLRFGAHELPFNFDTSVDRHSAGRSHSSIPN